MSKRDKPSPIGNVIREAISTTFRQWLDDNPQGVLQAMAGTATPSDAVRRIRALLRCPEVRAAIMEAMRAELVEMAQEVVAIELPSLLDALEVPHAAQD